MIHNLIKEKISRLTTYDIDVFAKENDIYLTNTELKNILEVIKNNWYELISGDSELIFTNNRSVVNGENYDKIRELFYFFKKKYQRFL